MVTYEDLDIRPFINASGTITTLGGSLMSDEVLDAMRHAAGSFIDLNRLNVEAGDYLARRIGVEGAFVSCGAASGAQLSAAACLTGPDPKRVAALPRTDGWKNEFVIPSVDPHIYIHQGIELCGGQLVRAGDRDGVTASDILSQVGDRTAAVVHFLGRQSKEQLAEVIEGCDRLGVPVMVDAVRMNASPNSGMGRGMKVGKEEILGLVTAVDLFLRGSDTDDLTTWEWQATQIVEAVKGCEGVSPSVLRDGQPAMPEFAPRAYIEFETPDRIKDVIGKLRAGEPSVVVRRSENRIIIDPMTMRPGDEEVVAQRLKEVLT